MAYFVEYQRALRTLRVIAIICGVLFLMAVIGRIAVHGHGAEGYMGNLESSPTAHVTHETLADGSRRTTVDDPEKKIHAVATIHGSDVHMEITQPSRSTARDSDDVHIGNVVINQTVDRKNGMEHVVINTTTHQNFPIGILFLTSIILGFIAASMVGGVLAKENDGHLELAWTKPVSRERYALGAFAVDVLTIVASQVLWVVTVLVCALLFFVPHVSFEPQAALRIALSLLGCIAWYAALTGWSASLKRGPGLVIGLGWLFGTIVPGLTQLVDHSTIPLLVVLHAVLLAITYLDPLAYIGLHSTGGVQVSGTPVGALHLAMPLACAALGALIVFYLAAAVAQWRRVEA